MVELMDRDKWTSARRGGSYLSGKKLEGTACHWPGTTTDKFGVESKSQVASRIASWRDYHVNGRGWSDIGYNFAVDQAGRVWDLRGLRRVGAHCASPRNQDANHEWIGVLFILGDEEEPTRNMINAFRYLREEIILDEYPHATAITGHGREPGVPGAQTSCPGPYVAREIRGGNLKGSPVGDEDDMTPEQMEQLSTLTAKKVVYHAQRSKGLARQIGRWVWNFPLNGEDGQVSYKNHLLQQVGSMVRKVLDVPIKRTSSGIETRVRTSDGGRYSYRAVVQAQEANAKLDAIILLLAEALQKNPEQVAQQVEAEAANAMAMVAEMPMADESEEEEFEPAEGMDDLTEEMDNEEPKLQA